MRDPWRAVAAAVTLALAGTAAAGCAVEEPSASQPGDPIGLSPAEVAAHEARPAPEPEPHVPPTAGDGGESAAEVVSLYAQAFANWTWRNVERKNGRDLARLSAGELRDHATINERELRRDGDLQQARATNNGRELALDVQGSEPGRRTVWIVLRETSTARGLAGLGDIRTTVYRALAERLDDGRWYVTEFEPQG